MCANAEFQPLTAVVFADVEAEEAEEAVKEEVFSSLLLVVIHSTAHWIEHSPAADVARTAASLLARSKSIAMSLEMAIESAHTSPRLSAVSSSPSSCCENGFFFCHACRLILDWLALLALDGVCLRGEVRGGVADTVVKGGGVTGKGRALSSLLCFGGLVGPRVGLLAASSSPSSSSLSSSSSLLDAEACGCGCDGSCFETTGGSDDEAKKGERTEDETVVADDGEDGLSERSSWALLGSLADVSEISEGGTTWRFFGLVCSSSLRLATTAAARFGGEPAKPRPSSSGEEENGDRKPVVVSSWKDNFALMSSAEMDGLYREVLDAAASFSGVSWIVKSDLVAAELESLLLLPLSSSSSPQSISLPSPLGLASALLSSASRSRSSLYWSAWSKRNRSSSAMSSGCDDWLAPENDGDPREMPNLLMVKVEVEADFFKSEAELPIVNL